MRLRRQMQLHLKFPRIAQSVFTLSRIGVIVAQPLARRPVSSDDLSLRIPAENVSAPFLGSTMQQSTSTHTTVTNTIFVFGGGEATREQLPEALTWLADDWPLSSSSRLDGALHS